ncbi:HWE histidine kinase domain-containing protein [Microvirga sp. BSC39]|uniref:HWE histidine kinase domain-containing protein n=1 Tax=Microvirga sp. BSC39 TaxID=1549810 RepID=UPI0004E92A27|nr:HWE histidine kinase domain-containing protein [Microvirga sp. BSC39]KFG67586.1 hypothetical protein JH26_21650 [Microvirga sp. BSC39]
MAGVIRHRPDKARHITLMAVRRMLASRPARRCARRKRREARQAIENRLFALPRSPDELARERWEGADLHDVVGNVIEPYQGLGDGRIRC